LAASSRLPVMYDQREFLDAGGLMSGRAPSSSSGGQSPSRTRFWGGKAYRPPRRAIDEVRTGDKSTDHQDAGSHHPTSIIPEQCVCQQGRPCSLALPSI